MSVRARPHPKLDLMVCAEVGAAYVPLLRRQMVAAFRMVPTRIRELSLALVGDKRMGELHREFMGVAGPTDVLTFPLEMDAKGRPVAGEIVICVPEARRQAKVRGGAIESEILLYGVHGLLHLSGHDDRTLRGI